MFGLLIVIITLDNVAYGAINCEIKYIVSSGELLVSNPPAPSVSMKNIIVSSFGSG